MNLKKLAEFLTSRKFALILLGALIILSVTGMIIPQNSPVSQQAYDYWSGKHPDLSRFLGKLGLTYLFTSPVFLILNFLLFVSLFLCTYRQIKSVKSILRLAPVLNLPHSNPLDLGLVSSDTGAEGISSILQRKGFRKITFHRSTGILRASKHASGYWGSVILHVGFLIIMVGALISGLTKMQGYMYIGEGQTKIEQAQSYWRLKTGPLFPGHKRFALRLDSQKIVYPEKDYPYTGSLTLTITDGKKVLEQEIAGNQFLEYKGRKFFPAASGYAVALVVTNEREEALGSFFHLRTIWHGTNPKPNYVGTAKFSELDIDVEATFYPDYQVGEDGLSTKTWKPVKPALDITVKKANHQLYKGPLELNGKVRVGDYLLRFSEYRTNQGFEVVSDRGTPVLFAGFWVSFLGLVLIYLLSPKHVWLKFEELPGGKHLILWGKSQKFPLIFQEELGVLAQQIKASAIVKDGSNV